MRQRRLSAIGLALLAATLTACGGSASPTTSGGEAGAAAVEVLGRVAERGTRGSILVFAYSDLAPGEDPSTHNAESVGTLAADGSFDLEVPPSATLTLAFLADGSNDGAVDEGDPLALLSAPELSDLQVGDRVTLADIRIDFMAHKVTAAIDVARAGEAPVTPTAVP